MLKANEVLKIAVLPGDGIGAEVTHAAIPIFELLQLPIQLSFGDIGWSYWRTEGTPIPERTWQLISNSDTVLLGAITSKPQREAIKELATQFQNDKLNYISPIIQLRQKLDLFANIRPCFSIKDEEREFNFCIIRENTEGLYSGFDYYPLPESINDLINEKERWRTIPANEISCTLRLQTKSGLIRLFQFAFDYASTQGINRVTFADKPNVLRQSSHFARELFEEIASHYPHINSDILNVDAVALWMIKRPEEFGVIVAENMFGDILSDVGAGVMGGLGFAPSANIGVNGSYFEPVHGSGPRMKPHSANPSAMFLTISMLLNHFGFNLHAKKISDSVAEVVREGRFITYDLGGFSTTMDMAKAIIDHYTQIQVELGNASFTLKEMDSLSNTIQKLKKYSTSEISDALDACGIEGALLNIKPLTPGLKLVGPAYTVQYKPNKSKSSTFKNAANYIDQVPPNSVIVIDNHGQNDCTVWGDILTQVALQNHIAGTVVHGAVRDVKKIRNVTYPLFCTDVFMRSGKNRVHKAGEQCSLTINKVLINPGDIIVADDNGVIVIPIHWLTEVIDKVQNIKSTEDKIKSAVQSGSTLKKARTRFHYDQPWLDHKK
ncbi:isocitrate/isopropylmalate family dehydrogenase [Legionella bononiensis]|uniref:Isocitrate/isopropylmalate dehydrogenase family protein n=1 Tax=Legionella bononiensis TaxID=2793102 RepID=A0ABS1W9T0_9GAMM|nr:isocitrate/isopropylmalate family dehydrogenase [Legionella bononiensis]MBL7480694.1 isocitrate/isopropylmalate dehydrogenase family protein [Legionella bononiensis]MBL7526107.1 isocitrate/isopropylmalate dehydrogenase family protein [Legionella bononiensis]MBL7563398.1 isocitrate/isopropylmalate dehydrogenase family protein [Legionella bononiensis]